MAASTSPIFVATPKNYFVTIPNGTSSTVLAGTDTLGTSVFSLATAGSNGSKITKIRIWHLGTNAASVVRFWVNNGSTNGTAANNVLVYEYTMASNSVSSTAASVPAEIVLDLPLQASYRLICATATSVNAGYAVSAEGGDY